MAWLASQVTPAVGLYVPPDGAHADHKVLPTAGSEMRIDEGILPANSFRYAAAQCCASCWNVVEPPIDPGFTNRSSSAMSVPSTGEKMLLNLVALEPFFVVPLGQALEGALCQAAGL